MRRRKVRKHGDRADSAEAQEKGSLSSSPAAVHPRRPQLPHLSLFQPRLRSRCRSNFVTHSAPPNPSPTPPPQQHRFRPRRDLADESRPPSRSLAASRSLIISSPATTASDGHRGHRRLIACAVAVLTQEGRSRKRTAKKSPWVSSSSSSSPSLASSSSSSDSHSLTPLSPHCTD